MTSHVFCLFSVSQITPDSQNDFGSYNCTATNVMGSESKEFLLIQAGLALHLVKACSVFKKSFYCVFYRIVKKKDYNLKSQIGVREKCWWFADL